MPELRSTLLLLGIMFLAVLVWWERRRSRRLPRDEVGRHSATLPGEPLQEMRATPRDEQLTLPEIRTHEPPLIVIGDLDSDQGSAPDARQAGPEEGRDGAEAAPRSPERPTEVVVEWPAEGERRLVGVRLVAGPGARYSGRLVRQALAAAGLVHGRFGIFHFPAPDGRVIFSVASLTKPGDFDPASMDAQRYAGLSVFAVLPGPLEPAQTIQRLAATARELADRLGGVLQDDRGQPLEPDRLAALAAEVMAPNAADEGRTS